MEVGVERDRPSFVIVLQGSPGLDASMVCGNMCAVINIQNQVFLLLEFEYFFSLQS